MLELWVVWRYLRTQQGIFFNWVSILAISGMALGVAALIVVMSVVSGFETSIKNSVIDVTGHLLLLKRGQPLDPVEEITPKIKKLVPEVQGMTPFVHVEGMLAHEGKISGVVVEGFEAQSIEEALNLKHRLRQGSFDLGRGTEAIPSAVLGGALADKFKLHVGEEFSVVLPKNNPSEKNIGFTPRLKKFRVVGIVDLGMYDYDTRFILTSVKAAQELGGLGNALTGLRIKLSDADLAPKAGFILSGDLGSNYITRDWIESRKNLFAAIELEKIVIFIVVLSLAVAASFNISSTLFISVLRRYSDMSILKTLGATRKRLLRFFTLQGMVLGCVGAILGVFLGLLICFIILKTDIIYVPNEIYHIDRLPVDIRPLDILIVLASSLGLCFFSTLAPALKGAKLNPVEGLRYDQR